MIDLPGAFVDGLNGVRVGNQEVSRGAVVRWERLGFFFVPPEGRIKTKPKEQQPLSSPVTASAPTRGKGAMAVIWVCAVAVFIF